MQSFSELCRTLESSTPSIIGVDGYHGAGKTTVADRLGAEMSLPVIHLDAFLRRHQGNFIQSLAVDELANALKVRPIIVEGVCLLEALRQADERPDFLIYVEGPEIDWASPRGTGSLAAEVLRYHYRWQPDQFADITYFSHIETTSDGEQPTAMHYRVEIDVAYIKAKTALSITLAIGGMLALCVGMVVLLYGVNGQDELLVKIFGFEMSAKGLGGVIMGTSAVWAYCSYRSRPKYSQVEHIMEKRTADGGMERSTYSSSTQFVVHPINNERN